MNHQPQSWWQGYIALALHWPCAVSSGGGGALTAQRSLLAAPQQPTSEQWVACTPPSAMGCGQYFFVFIACFSPPWVSGNWGGGGMQVLHSPARMLAFPARGRYPGSRPVPDPEAGAGHGLRAGPVHARATPAVTDSISPANWRQVCECVCVRVCWCLLCWARGSRPSRPSQAHVGPSVAAAPHPQPCAG